MTGEFDAVVLFHGFQRCDDLGMPCLISSLPARTASQEAFQLAQVVHAKAMEITQLGIPNRL